MSKAEHYVDGKVMPLDDGMKAVDGNANPAGDTASFPGDEKVSPAGDTATSTEAGSPEEGVHKREQWTRKIDFLLACIGFSVGLGNVWRFPYLCYKNGGATIVWAISSLTRLCDKKSPGAFLIPYFICVIIGGIPLFFIEVALGQFMTKGGIGAWMICPLFQGVGFASIVVVFLVDCYYNVILAWGFYYLFSSFTLELPWSKCGHSWNTELCKDENTNISAFPANTNFTDPVTEYWENKALGISTGIDDMGVVKWDLCLCLLFAWIVVYLCICKGIKSSGKVMYVTATSPYLLMLILLIRGCTLDGAGDGIKFYLIPKWEKLLEAQVWVDAGTQIFFSYSIALGTLTALGSFNQFNHNCYRDSVIFALANSGTSFFAGFVIFSVLGFMAKEAGVSVEDVAESGPGLAFIAYPQAVASMPFAPPLWSILFFIMLILLGLDSQFVGVEGFVTAAVDMYPHILRKGYRKEIFIGCVCSLCFFVGIPMVMNGGMYVFQIFDYYAGSRIIVLVAFFECVALAWIYGINRFYDNMAMMLGRHIDPYMKISWTVTSPVFCLVIFALIMYTYSDLTYNRTYSYPDWAIAIGWMMACSSIIMIPIVMVARIIRAEGSLPQRIRFLLRPQLAPHQLRPQDSPMDLAPEYRDMELNSIGGGAPAYHPPPSYINTEGAPTQYHPPSYINPTFTSDSAHDNTKL